MNHLAAERQNSESRVRRHEALAARPYLEPAKLDQGLETR